MGSERAQVVHGSDRLEEPVGVGLGYVAAEVLADLVLVEGQHGEDQVVLAVGAFALLPVGEEVLVVHRPEILRPARQEEVSSGWLSSGVGHVEGEDFEKGSGQALSVAWGEVDEDLVKAVKDDQGGFTADGVQHVIHHDRGLGRNTEEMGEHCAQPKICQTRGGKVA